MWCLSIWEDAQGVFFFNKSHMGKEQIELVHTDLCGPMSIPFLSHGKYFILFTINDCQNDMNGSFGKQNSKN